MSVPDPFASMHQISTAASSQAGPSEGILTPRSRNEEPVPCSGL